MVRWRWICALVLFVCLQGAAQTVKEFAAAEKAIWTSPFRLNAKKAAWLAGGAAVITGLVLSDVDFSAKLPRNGTLQSFGTITSRFGSSYGLLATTAGLYLAGDQRLKKSSLVMGEAAVHAFVVTYALKTLAARERPNLGSGRGHFFSGYDQAATGENSFPSGHAMAGWAAAAAISRQYPDKKWVPWVAYGLASTVSVARVASQRHYAGDVVAGAGIGYVLGRYVAGHRAAPHLIPIVDPVRKTAGLGLQWNLARP